MSEKRKLELAVTLLMVGISALLILDYLFRLHVLTAQVTGIEKVDILIVRTIQKTRPKLLFFRVMLVCFMLAQGYFQRLDLKDGGKKLADTLTYITPVFVTAFILGYLPSLLYNIYVYPVIFLSLFYLVPKVMGTLMIKDSNTTLADVNSKGKDSLYSVTLQTQKGPLVIPNLRQGLGIEGTQGAGKTESIAMPLIVQMVDKGACGLVYDYKGDLSHADGAKLTKTVYTALRHSNSKVKFALLNWQLPEYTNQTNVFAPRYLESFNHCKQIATAVLFNIEKPWAKGQDKFWANNAIAVYSATLWFFKRQHKKYCTLPHITEFLLNDFKRILKILSTDEDVAARIRPIVTAIENDAGPQLSGAESSTQFPTAIMRSPEIYWVFNPPQGKDLDLDLNNKENPIILCVANYPDISEALSPALGAVIQVARMQLGKPGKHPVTLWVIDELPTIFIDKLDRIAAEFREYGVCAVYGIQTFSQLVRDYTEIFAKVVWNLGSIFTGMTDVESAKRVSEMIGEYRRTEYSLSESDSSGPSTTRSERNEKVLKPSEIAAQPAGHFSGRIAGGDPAYFSVQLNRFIYPFEQIKPFGYPVFLDDEKQQKAILKKLVEENYDRVKTETDAILAEYNNLFPIIIKPATAKSNNGSSLTDNTSMQPTQSRNHE